MNPAAFVPYPFKYRRRAPRAGAAEPALQRHAVVIAGGGIAGLTLALGLAVQGVRSVVIEADDTVCEGSRAICFSRRSLEIFQRLGVAERLLARGLAWHAGRSYHRSTEVLHFEMPRSPDDVLPPMLNLQQYHVEEILVQALEAHADLVDLRWGTRLGAVTPRVDGVALDLAGPDGRAYAIEAEWLAACDGGRSRVREALGLALEGTAYEGRYVVVDILLHCDLPTERLAWFDPPSNPGSTVLMHRQPDDVWRIDYQVADHEDAAEVVRPEQVLPRVASHLRMMGIEAPWSPIWITLYRANALSLASYRHGRVLFAGDAAHLVPIFGVRGANSTIDDADNLAWKLALVATGRAEARLLDSYSTERVGAARENLAYGRKSTEFMAPPDFAFTALRAAVLALAVDTPALRPLINPRQSSPVRYADSPLNAPEVPGTFRGGPEPGSVLPSPRVRWHDREADRWTDGHLGQVLRAGAFTVLHFAPDGGLPDGLGALARQCAQDGVDLRLATVRRAAERTAAAACATDADGTAFARFGVAGEAVYAVRPDGHVLGRWAALDLPALERALRAALGRAH